MNLFELAAVLTLDRSGYERGLDDAQDKANSFGSKLKSGLTTAAKVSAAALGTASTAVAGFSKQALDSYGDYEQLVGGVETLFGVGGQSLQEYAASVGRSVQEVQEEFLTATTGQRKILNAADEAYKTAGLSANAYMETVTSFAASLVQSLEGDTSKAADAADMAIVDMADNANKIGTAMESIQYAYQGFAKQNYTMLDNLKLGYGGTKEEMKRLLSDAEKLMGLDVGSLDISNFSDIVTAIHAVQEEMGIAGTTAKEASSTIQGSVSSMKSAWANLVTGIADENAYLPELMENVIDSAITVGENIVPRIEQILDGIGTAIEQLNPILSQKVMPMITKLLPKIVDKGVELIGGLVDAIADNLEPLAKAAMQIVMKLIDGLGKMLPQLVEAGLNIVTTLAKGIADNIETIVPTLTGVILTIAQTLTNPDTLTGLLDAGLQIILGLVNGIIAALPSLIEALPIIIDNIVTTLLAALPMIIDAGVQLLTALVTAMPDIIAKIVEVIPQIIDGIINALTENLDKIIEAGVNLLVSLVQNLPTIILTIVDAIPQIVDGIVTGILGNLDKIIEAGVKLFTALIFNLPTIIGEIVTAVPQIIGELVNTFVGKIGELVNVGKMLIEGLWEGIKNTGQWLKDKIGGFFGGVVDKIKGFFGIHSPSTLFAELGNYMAQGLGIGFGDEMENVANDMTKAIPSEFDTDIKANVTPVDYLLADNVRYRLGNETSSQTTDQLNPDSSKARAQTQAQPLTVIVQLSSGVELGRALIDNINQAKRVDGLVY